MRVSGFALMVQASWRFAEKTTGPVAHSAGSLAHTSAPGPRRQEVLRSRLCEANYIDCYRRFESFALKVPTTRR